MDDLEAIKQVKARYCRTMDTKDWAGMRHIFTDDVTMDSVEAGGGVKTGADDFMVFLQGAVGEALTVHHCYTPEIAIVSDAEASGTWAMEDILRFPDGSEMHGYGHYHETYRKQDSQWRISYSKLTRLRMDFTPAPG